MLGMLSSPFQIRLATSNYFGGIKIAITNSVQLGIAHCIEQEYKDE